MNKVLLQLVILGYLFSVSALSKEIITIGLSTVNQNALNFKESKLLGFLSAKYQCVIENFNTQYQVLAMPHARVIEMLKHGKVSIALPLINLPDRNVYATFAKTMYHVEFELFYHALKGERSLTDILHEANDVTFVSKRATAAPMIFKDELSSMGLSIPVKYYEVDSWASALESVKHHRATLTVIPKVVTKAMSEIDFKGLNRQLLSKREVSLYISNKVEDQKTLLQSINRSIDLCNSNNMLK